jgi:hypothetical protein
LAAQPRCAKIAAIAGNPVQPSEPLMKKLLSTLFVAMFAVAHGPLLAQEKKAEPTKEEAKKTDAKKTDAKTTDTKTTDAKKTDAKKDEPKKKEKKGGC